MAYEEGKSTRLELLAKRLGPFIERARNNDYEWTQSPLADMPFWDRVVLEAMDDQGRRIKSLEKIRACVPVRETGVGNGQDR